MLSLVRNPDVCRDFLFVLVYNRSIFMDITFWKGVFMGILIALPTGPVSFLIIRRMYLFGIRSGMYSVYGSMISDAFYAAVVGFGLRKIQHFLIGISGYAELIAGIALLAIGYKAITEKHADLEQDLKKNHPVKDIVSISFLNLLNPTLVLSFGVIFIGLGMGRSVGDPKLIGTFLIGISSGTLLFWYLLGRWIEKMRKKNHMEAVGKVNRVIGVILFAAGIILLLLAAVHIIFPK